MARIGKFFFFDGSNSLGTQYYNRVLRDTGIVESLGCVNYNAPNILRFNPSLLLIPSGYKGGKLYAEIPTNGNGDLTWTRGSTAIRTNSSGLLESMATGVPRLSYMYGSCPAALLEPQRTNLALYSETFDNASWTKNASATITANSTTAPDGTTTADTLTVSASTFSGLYQVISGSSAIYTISVYVKKGTKNWFYFLNTTGTIQVAWFDLNNGILGTVTSGYTATMTSVGNGWYRCSVSQTTNQLLSYFQFGLSDANNSSLPSSSGTAFIWGAQLEAGAYPTTYIPTTSATATRVADSAVKTGISSLIGQSEGTIFVDFYVSGIGANNINIYNNDRTPSTISTNAIVFKPNGSIDCQTFLGNGTYASITISASTYSVGQRIKLAYRYKSGDFAVYINGIQKATATNTLTFVGTKSQIYLDDNAVIYGYQEAVHYNQFALFTTALTNAKLIELTTL